MTTGAEPSSDYRLDSTVLPRRYELVLAPDLDAATFTGSERIEIEVIERVEAITMNAIELEVQSATASANWATDGEVGEAVQCAIELDADRERLVLRGPSAFEPGHYRLDLSFSGILNDKLCGFYRSTFIDDDGVERVIATTQFEDTDARRAFPCFDEPDKKAVFSITLDVPSEMFAVSNSKEIETTPLEGGARRVRFADTIPMSTYIVAFVVGPLEATEPIVSEGVEIRVIYRPGKAHLVGPALDCAAHSVAFFGRYFSIPYPGDKLDLVALPDFAAGAMENLGCVTFREAILLADPDATSRPELQRLCEVVEHEIAHMWFGDLVTMRWWNGIWLNEAFATFMSLVCQDDYRPEWQCFTGFLRDKASALTVDGLHHTRPIEFPVARPSEAAAMFDVLTYEKGASVLWMIQQYVGPDVFRDGVRRYLEAHSYSNTETTDLWDAIEAEVKEGAIRAVMDSWIFQGGYPLVHVGAIGDRSIELSQKPFAYLPGGSRGESAIGSDWLVPLIVRHEDGEEERLILDGAPATIGQRGERTVVNARGAGFYRLSYDPKLLAPLVDRPFELFASERFNLIADLWAAAIAGPGDLSQFFALAKALADEEEPDVWSVIIGAFGVLDRVIAADDRPKLAAFARRTLQPVLIRVGWEPTDGEDEQVPLLRSSLVAALGTIGEDPAVIERARELFVASHVRNEAVDPNLTNAVLAVVVSHATRAEFDAILERWRTSENPMDQIRHLNSLAALTDEALAAEVRELCRTEVRSQNAPYLLAGLLRGREVGPATWTFVKEHFDELAARFPDNSIHRMLDGVAWLVEIEDDGSAPIVAEVAAFCDSHVDPGRRRLVDQSIERLEINVAFARRERSRLVTLLG